MAKAARGLPDNFTLDLPDEKPVIIGDFLDEEPLPVVAARKAPKPHFQFQSAAESAVAKAQFRPEIVRDAELPAPELPRSTKQPSVIRYQLNLTPKSKTMLEELVEHVRTFSSQSDARTSEVFQGIMTLLHNAMDELELAELPRRGAWGSVTAKNFPGALSVAFEKAIVQAVRKRGM